MIELVSEERCIRCNLCVSVCPMNVFDRVPDQPPVIARQQDCQTCYMCEVYCPMDALYVDPEAQGPAPHPIDEVALSRQGLLGSYRAAVGWGNGRVPWAQRDPSFRLAFRRSAGERWSDPSGAMIRELDVDVLVQNQVQQSLHEDERT